MPRASRSNKPSSLRAEVALLTKRVEVLEEQLLKRGEKPMGREDGGDVQPFEILSVDAKPLAQEGDLSRMSWKLTVQSHADKELRVDALLQFVDMDSFVLEEATVSGLVLTAGERQKFGGIKEVSCEVAESVMGVKGALSLVG